MINPPIFNTPLDDILTEVSDPHVAGTPNLTIADPSGMGSPSSGHPIRITCIRRSDSIRVDYLVTDISGHDLTVAPVPGFIDIDLDVHDVVGVAICADTISQLHGLASDLVTASNDSLRASANLSDLANPAAGRAALGLGSAAVRLATDFLAVSGGLAGIDPTAARNNLGLGSAAVSNSSDFAPAHAIAAGDITSGTLAPARLATGTPGPGKYPDGSGAWTSLSAATGSDAHYVHVQAVPASTWTIPHGMGKYPAVHCRENGTTPIEGLVSYPDLDTVTVAYTIRGAPAPITGVAYLN